MIEGANKTWPIDVHSSLHSTNTFILEKMCDGALAEPKWVLAIAQTAGRGTRGKSWQALKGNLFLSAGFWDRSQLSPTRFGFVAAIAIAETLKQYAPQITPQFKWPNDVRIDKAKVSGILVETLQRNARQGIVVGIGVNLVSKPEGLDQRTCCLHDFAASCPSPIAFAELLVEKFENFRQIADDNFDHIAKLWNKSAEALNQNIEISSGGQRLTCQNLGLSPTGALRIKKPDGSQCEVYSGEVF